MFPTFQVETVSSASQSLLYVWKFLTVIVHFDKEEFVMQKVKKARSLLNQVCSKMKIIVNGCLPRFPLTKKICSLPSTLNDVDRCKQRCRTQESEAK